MKECIQRFIRPWRVKVGSLAAAIVGIVMTPFDKGVTKGSTPMARRRKTSFADDLMDLVARLPWWVGVLLAIGGYLLLHSIAAMPLTAAAAPGQVGMAATQALWKALASAGQYLVPILCLGGTFMSAWRRRQRSRLMADVAASGAADVLDGMSWREFEVLVGEAFRLKGFSVWSRAAAARTEALTSC
jgi:restriction system protein